MATTAFQTIGPMKLRKAREARERAIAAGLTFRPHADTVADLLAWFHALPADRQAKPRAGITAEREAEVLAAWKARGAG